MYRDKERYGQDPTTVLRSKTKFNDPLNWKEPRLIFTCSWSDWFIDEADKWRPEAWEIIKATPHHTYQILTKRPERIKQCLPDDWGEGYPNVWLGVSVESAAYIKRIETLGDVRATVRFVSVEPMIGPCSSLGIYDDLMDWVIVGGESGNEQGKYRYRKCEIEWIREIISLCEDANVPVFVKQLGTHLAKKMRLKDRHGGDISEWPESIQIRQMPKIYEPIS